MENNIASQYYKQQQGRLPLKKRKYRDERLELDTENSTNRLLQYNNVYKPAQVKDTENSDNGFSKDDSDPDDDEEIGAMIYASSKTARARAAAACKYVESSNSNSEEEELEEWVQCEKCEKWRRLPPQISAVNLPDVWYCAMNTWDSNVASCTACPELSPSRPVQYSYLKKSFEQRIADLRAYKERHGHVNVKKSDDKILYGFCKNFRYARNNPEKSRIALTENRIASLDALGFVWTVIDRETKSFAQRIEDLRAYKEEHGHVNVRKSDNKSLYTFCINVRHARKHPEKSERALTDDRIASLDALGFEWTVKVRP